MNFHGNIQIEAPNDFEYTEYRGWNAPFLWAKDINNGNANCLRFSFGRNLARGKKLELQYNFSDPANLGYDYSLEGDMKDWGDSHCVFSDRKNHFVDIDNLVSNGDVHLSFVINPNNVFDFNYEDEGNKKCVDCKIFLNGQEMNIGLNENLWKIFRTEHLDGINSFEIGRMQGGDTYYYLQGKVRALRLYNRCLSEDEINKNLLTDVSYQELAEKN